MEIGKSESLGASDEWPFEKPEPEALTVESQRSSDFWTGLPVNASAAANTSR